MPPSPSTMRNGTSGEPRRRRAPNRLATPVLRLWKRSDAAAPQFVDKQHCRRSLLLIVQPGHLISIYETLALSNKASMSLESLGLPPTARWL
jgi:hypothetical protein